MFRYFLSVALLSAAYGAVLPARKLSSIALPSAGRIFGGEETTIDKVPYQVAVLTNVNTLRCSGSVLRHNVVITSGSCVAGWQFSGIVIRSGSDRFNSGGQTNHMREKFVHELYDSKTLDYDIALLELFGSVSESSIPISIPPQDTAVPDNVIGTISGWGRTEDSVGASRVIYKGMVPTVNHEECRVIYEGLGYRITERMTCAGHMDGGAAFCNGDSGAPLVIDNVLVAMGSWSTGCDAKTLPQVYTNLASLSDWIHKTLTLIPE